MILACRISIPAVSQPEIGKLQRRTYYSRILHDLGIIIAILYPCMVHVAFDARQLLVNHIDVQAFFADSC
jgi:hypothetical protein